MNDATWHAKHIAFEKKPESVLHCANNKLVEFLEYNERFVFLKKLDYYIVKRLAELNSIRYRMELDLLNPKHRDFHDEELKQWRVLEIKKFENDVNHYERVLRWGAEQINVIHTELSIINKLGKSWKNSIGPEILQLPENFNMEKFKKANHLNVELINRESSLFIGLLMQVGIILRFNNTNLGELWGILTGYSSDVIRGNLSSFGSGLLPPKGTYEKELSYWQNIRDKIQEMFDYANMRVNASENLMNSEEKETL